jgi:hypothetical protein
MLYYAPVVPRAVIIAEHQTASRYISGFDLITQGVCTLSSRWSLLIYVCHSLYCVLYILGINERLGNQSINQPLSLPVTSTIHVCIDITSATADVYYKALCAVSIYIPVIFKGEPIHLCHCLLDVIPSASTPSQQHTYINCDAEFPLFSIYLQLDDT